VKTLNGFAGNIYIYIFFNKEVYFSKLVLLLFLQHIIRMSGTTNIKIIIRSISPEDDGYSICVRTTL